MEFLGSIPVQEFQTIQLKPHSSLNDVYTGRAIVDLITSMGLIQSIHVDNTTVLMI